MSEKQTIAKVREEFPFPWHVVTYPNGRVTVQDDTSKEVSMPAIMTLLVDITTLMSKRAPEPK